MPDQGGCNTASCLQPTGTGLVSAGVPGPPLGVASVIA
jgi:hypothetical protein